MRLFNRRKGTQELGQTAVQGSAYPAGQEQSGRKIDWRRAIPRLLVILIALVAIVLIIMWLFGAFKEEEPLPAPDKLGSKPSTSQPAGEAANKTANKPANPSSSSAPAATNAPSNAAGPSTAPAPASPSASGSTAANTQSGQQLSNTGPGETLALFAATTVAGTAYYHIRLRRQTTGN